MQSLRALKELVKCFKRTQFPEKYSNFWQKSIMKNFHYLKNIMKF